MDFDPDETPLQTATSAPPAAADSLGTVASGGSRQVDAVSAPPPPKPSSRTRGRWASRWARPRRSTGIMLDGDSALVVTATRNADAIRIVNARRVDPSSLRKNLGRIAPAGPIIVGDTEDFSLFRIADYPPMPRKDLERVLAREVKGMLPDADRAAWDYATVGTSQDGIQQRILVAAAPEDYVIGVLGALDRKQVRRTAVGCHRLSHLVLAQQLCAQDDVCALVDIHPASFTIDICEPGSGASQWPDVLVSRNVAVPYGEDRGELLLRIAAEVQRSLVYYRQVTHGQHVTRALITGNRDDIADLAADLAARLTVPAERIEIAQVADVRGPAAEALAQPGDWDTALGLAVQGLFRTAHRIDLVPHAVRDAANQRLRRMVAVGAAAVSAFVFAVAALALDGAAAMNLETARRLSRQLERNRPLVARYEALLAQQRQLADRIRLIAGLNRGRLPYDALLRQVAAAVPGGVELQSAGISRDDRSGTWQISLEGDISGGSAPSTLAELLRNLRGAPLISKALLMPVDTQDKPARITARWRIDCQIAQPNDGGPGQ